MGLMGLLCWTVRLRNAEVMPVPSRREYAAEHGVSQGALDKKCCLGTCYQLTSTNSKAEQRWYSVRSRAIIFQHDVGIPANTNSVKIFSYPLVV